MFLAWEHRCAALQWRPGEGGPVHRSADGLVARYWRVVSKGQHKWKIPDVANASRLPVRWLPGLKAEYIIAVKMVPVSS